MSDKKKVIITDESEEFTKSDCPCDFCEDTHKKVAGFHKNIPISKLQKGMMEVIEKIEKRIKKDK